MQSPNEEYEKRDIYDVLDAEEYEERDDYEGYDYTFQERDVVEIYG